MHSAVEVHPMRIRTSPASTSDLNRMATSMVQGYARRPIRYGAADRRAALRSTTSWSSRCGLAAPLMCRWYRPIRMDERVWIPYGWAIERTRRESLDHDTQVNIANEIGRLDALNKRDLELIRDAVARRRPLR